MSSTKQIYIRLLDYLKPQRKRFFTALFAMVVYGSSDGVLPYILKRVLDDVFGSQNKRMLGVLVIVVMVFAAVRGLFAFLQRYLTAQVGLGIVQQLRNEISAKLLSLSPAFFRSQSSGNLISRVTNDTLLVRTALTDAAAVVLRDSIRVVALIGMAIYLDPVLALIAIVGLPICFAPIIKFGKKIRRLSRSGQDYFGSLTSLLHEAISGNKVVQSFVREDYEQQRFEEENDRFTKSIQKAEKYAALSAPTNELVASLAIAGVLTYGGLSVINQVRTQGDFIAFLTAMFLLYEPVKNLSRVSGVVQAGVAAAERIFEILDITPDIRDRQDAKPLSTSKFDISYENVWFSYATDISNANTLWVLKDINLTLRAGQTLALVGMSGGGKSSLVSLLPRFYDPQRGRVTIGGADIREVTLSSLRSCISVVDQHTFLFNQTVFQNIAYGKPNATAAQVEAAAKAANAHQFIEKLPNKYDSVIGEQGLTLSGGERARIAIARALLKDAPILILDEATASLDSESEGIVQDAIDRLMEGRTVLVIAHRLATVRRADNIAVIVNGQVVEQGSHDKLLSQGGEYFKLYNLQFRHDDNNNRDEVRRQGVQ